MLYAKTAARADDLPWAVRARAPSWTELAGRAADSPSVRYRADVHAWVSAMSLGNLSW